MKDWNNISLGQFQQIQKVIGQKIPDLDKTLFATCIVFGLTEYELDKASVKKASRLINKVNKIFAAPFNPKSVKRLGRYYIDYDISAMTFGQYIELAFFLSTDVIANAHYTMATVSHLPFRKNNSAHHRMKSEYFLKKPVPEIIGTVTEIIKGFTAFNKEYQTLFGLSPSENEGEQQSDFFNKRYGWIYSASQVAEYERITLEQTFALPVRQAFNDLAYLKAKVKYESEQLNKK